MKKFILFIFSIIITHNLSANDYLKSMNNFELLYKKNIESNYKTYKNQIVKNEAYYKKVVEMMWGKENVKFSSPFKSVFYDKNLKTREIIDYKKGTLTIQSIEKKEKDIDKDFVEKRIKKLKDTTIKKALKKDPLQTSTNIIVSKLLDKKLNEFIEVKNETLLVRKKGKIVTVTLKLKEDHRKKRIDFFLPFIQKYAKLHNFDNSYILAIIHTESRFNPFAVSHIPAYGLMQIVPSSGGKDAYKKLFGYEGYLTKEYLFNPEKNLELGIKYLQIIRDIYLKGIEDKKSLAYCVTTSYNAGIGNVYKVFTNYKNKRKKAIEIINNESNDNIYKKLNSSSRLTEEARNYISSVIYNERIYKSYN